MTTSRLRCAAFVTCVAALAAGSLPAAERLTIEKVAGDWNEWAGMSPKAYRWSPDGKWLIFEWNRDRAPNPSLYRVPVTGGTPVKLTAEEERLVPPAQPGRGGSDSGPATGTVTNRSRTVVAWEKDRDVYLMDLTTGALRRVTNTEAAETSVAFSHDQGEVLFESANNLYAYSLADGGLVQLTNFRTGKDPAARPSSEIERYIEDTEVELFDVLEKRREEERRLEEKAAIARRPRPPAYYIADTQSVMELRLSPDERFVTFVLVDHARRNRTRAAEMPKYVTRSGYVETNKNPGVVKASDAASDFSLGVLTLADGAVRWVDAEPFAGKRKVSWNGVTFSGDGQRAFAWAGSQDHHDLWLASIDVAAATARVLVNDHDDAWVRGFRTGRFHRGDGHFSGFLPDHRTVYFLSERDGWFHLYAVSDGGDLRQLTKGAFEIVRPVLSGDGTRFYFLSNEAGLGERHVYSMPIAGGPRTKLTAAAGWWDNFYLSPDEKTMALEHSTPDAPFEAYLMENRPGATPRKITSSTTDEFRRYRWQTPEYVTFKDAHGWTVHGELFRPASPHPSRPAIVHVHGTGWTEGVTRQFYSYVPENRAEFQFYADQGYTVLNVDYKASRGYGRESRVAIYRQMGTPEVESLDAAVAYLVQKEGVDPKRIGLYGHSQGGFVTLMGLFTRPGMFAAGAAHAAPVDFAHSALAAYTTRILDVPWREKEAFQRSSPIYHADKLQDRLLLINGLEDGPVAFQEALRLTQRLMELGKTGWELAVYPVEGHTMRQPSSRLDMQRRRFALFEEVLKEAK